MNNEPQSKNTTIRHRDLDDFQGQEMSKIFQGDEIHSINPENLNISQNQSVISDQSQNKSYNHTYISYLLEKEFQEIRQQKENMNDYKEAEATQLNKDKTSYSNAQAHPFAEKYKKEGHINIKKTNTVMIKFRIFFQFMLLPLIGLFANVASIVELIMSQRVRIGDDTDPDLQLRSLQIFILVVWIFFYAWNMIFDDDYIYFISRILNWHRVIDLLNIIHISLMINLQNPYKNRHWAIILLSIIRSLIIFRCLDGVQLTANLIQKYQSENLNDQFIFQSKLEQQEDQLTKFIASSVVRFLAAIFFEASVILSMDQITDYEGYLDWGNQKKLNYIVSAYYVIVCFSTIGYGDIIPLQNITRYTMVIILIANLTVLSNFLGKLTEMLFMRSSFDQQTAFSDHLVVIGIYPDYFISDFLQELFQLDKVRGLLDSESNSEKLKVLLVGPHDPSAKIRSILNFYDSNINYDNEVDFLLSDIHSRQPGWMIKAGLKYARSVLAISLSPGTSVETQYQHDKQVAFAVSGIVEFFPDLEINMIIQTSYGESLQTHRDFKNIHMIHSRKMNQYILANSVENHGLSTIITNLLTMKLKQPPTVTNQDSLLALYVEEMDQEIYAYKFSQYFFGKTFSEALQCMYYYSLNINDDLEKVKAYKKAKQEKQISKLDAQGITRPKINGNQDRGPLLLAVETKIAQQKDEQNSFLEENLKVNSPNNSGSRAFQIQMQEEVYLNCPDYVIQQGDIGYLICEDYKMILTLEECLKNTASFKQKLEKNSNFLQKNNSDPEMSNFLIQRMYEQTFKKYQYFSVDKNMLEERQDSSMYNEFKNDSQENHNKTIDSYSFFKCTFDLAKDMQKPRNFFNRHVILIGELESFERIVTLIRLYSDRAVILFSENSLNPLSWKDFNETFTNVFYARGEIVNIEHLQAIGVDKAHKVIILADRTIDSGTAVKSDSAGICLARVLIDHFKQVKFIVEVREQGNIKFICRSPDSLHEIQQINEIFDLSIVENSFQQIQQRKIVPLEKNTDIVKVNHDISKNSENQHDLNFNMYPGDPLKFQKRAQKYYQQISYFYWSSFVQGNISFTSSFSSGVARTVYNRKWMNFIDKLTSPPIKVSVKEKKLNNFQNMGKINDSIQDQDTDNFTKIRENRAIHTITLNVIQAEYFQIYGILQSALMSSSSNCIALGLVQKEFTLEEQIKNTSFWNQSLGMLQNMNNLVSRKELQTIMMKFIQTQATLTNPSFYTSLDAGDMVIVIGDFLHQEIHNMSLNPQSSYKLYANNNIDGNKTNNLNPGSMDIQIRQQNQIDEIDNLFTGRDIQQQIKQVQSTKISLITQSSHNESYNPIFCYQQKSKLINMLKQFKKTQDT